MKFFYRFLRCAALMVMMMPLMVLGQITPTTDTNGNGTIEDNEKNLYLIQTNQFESFYIAPNGSNLNTANLPHASMLWYFLEAEYDEVNEIQYYYIINNSTNKYMCHGGGTSNTTDSRGVTLVDKDASNEERCKFKFVEDNSNETDGFYNIDVKGNPTYFALNKQSGNVSTNNIRLTDNQYVHNTNSKWKFIPYDGTLVWPNPPFTVSTDIVKHYYKIHNKNANTYYISTNPSTSKVTYSSTESDYMTWYFKEAPSGGLMKYYYIINPASGDKYMYFDGDTGTGNQTDAISLKGINEANVVADRFMFVIVQAAVIGNNDTPINGYYMIVPKLLIGNLWNSNSLGNNSPSNGSNMGIIPGRGADVYSHWSFEATNDCSTPTITYSSATGKITITTIPVDADIHYTTNGDEPSSSVGELYNDPFVVSSPVTIKAIATKTGFSDSGIATKSFDQVATPDFEMTDDGTVRLTCATDGASIYYEMGSTPSDPTTSSTHYAGFIKNAAGQHIKAIAVKDGLINSAILETGQITFTCATPVIRETSPTTFSIICSYPTSGVTIRYNKGINPDDPTPESGTIYNGPVTFNESETVKAIAYATNYTPSDVVTWPHDYSQDYLTFRVLTGGTIGWKAYEGLTKTIQYSINDGDWTVWTSTSDGATISVQAGNLVRLRGTAYPYATSKDAYSGFEGGTATYEIEGNIHSLIYGDDFAGNNTMPDNTYMFCSLFKKSKATSAENLILPATTLRNYCYRALFSYATSLVKPCALPATTLATGCYWYMFERCAITAAPELNATTLVNECYGHMFNLCSNLSYIKCTAVDGFSASKALENWVSDVASSGVFVKNSNKTWPSGISGIPSGWTIYNDYLLYSPEISCDGEYITITCTTPEASIYYRLNQTGDFSEYSSPIPFNETATVEAYSTKDNNTSSTEIITFEKYDSPLDESTRLLDSWTYGGNQVTLPYSVNCENGHSSSYSKGSYTFETTATLYRRQPTYLWFQHADQSADIYVDDVFVTTHWGGYNAFFVDISNYVHQGTNQIKVVLNNTTRDVLAPNAGDFNFNATLGKVKLLTSPVLPSIDYGYDGFHITSTVTSQEATITVKTAVPAEATVICSINGDNCEYSNTQISTGEEITFETTINNPHLWNGISDPYLYDVTLTIKKDDVVYHQFERGYGLRFYEYVINKTVGNENYTGFLLNGSPYLLRGVCTHHDLEGKANALTDEDIANDFAIIQELGCNFVRLAHYPHPKEVYDWCDRLGIIVQTEVPCVNRFQNTLPQDYYDHLYIQYEDMVRQHYNHPCIMFWGLFNEATTDDTSIAKPRLEDYRTYIKNIDPERWVGYVVSHSSSNPSSLMGNPNMDWFGCNIYVGWYISPDINDPTYQLNTRKTNIITNLHKPLAFSEYGCGGTQSCHSDDFMTTTTRGNNPRHDIEYQMWLHEGHIAAIKNFPELLFTSQWQLFDIAVSSRREGYTICLDGESTYEDNNLKYLNNKGLVERDHKTKKDPFYLYKAWWNQTDKFVHICGKDYEKLNGRAIKCYTNDGDKLTLFVNNVEIQTVTVENNIATFTARDFNQSDVIRVNGATTYDAFTLTNDFITDGNWDVATNWNGHAVPTAGSDVIIRAECTIPNGVVVQANHITIGENGSLTIAEGGQLIHSNEGVVATVEKDITAYTVIQNQGEEFTDGWYFIASPITDDYTPTGSMVENTYDLYRLNNTTWENYKQSGDHYHFNLESGRGYLYANSEDITLQFTGTLKPYAASESVNVSTGWNLIGNPFAYNVYANRAFYKMNDDKTGIEAVSAFSTSPIAPCTGIVVEAETDGDVIFSKEAPAQSQGSNGSLLIALKKANARNNALLDNAIVSFNEDGQLGKFYFGTQNANIYIPRNGKEYAIAFSNCQDDIPLNFKTAETGIYTISFEGEEMYLNSIYLIDMLTGQEIDLSFNPSYTFLGSAADRSERFKIVFKTGFENAPSDIFAYQNGNDIVVSGEGELQIFDVMGRLVSTHHISGVERFNVKTQGVYIFKLNDKTQKIVIR